MLGVSDKAREIRHLVPKNLTYLKRGMDSQLRDLRKNPVSIEQNLKLEIEIHTRGDSGRWSLRRFEFAKS